MTFSDYIVYADESGDHGLTAINPQNPVFVLALCVFKKDEYRTQVVPEIQRLKFKYWGHDGVVLHSRDIRKAKEDFALLQNAARREAFVNDLTAVLEAAPFQVIAAALDKTKLNAREAVSSNPYRLALRSCVARLREFLSANSVSGRTWLLVESRGLKEDRELETEFRIIVESDPSGGSGEVGLRFMKKQHNSAGLQVADLVAYPIGRHLINPVQLNRAYETVDRKTLQGRVDLLNASILP